MPLPIVPTSNTVLSKIFDIDDSLPSIDENENKMNNIMQRLNGLHAMIMTPQKSL
jgi:hypothetical protein